MDKPTYEQLEQQIVELQRLVEQHRNAESVLASYVDDLEENIIEPIADELFSDEELADFEAEGGLYEIADQMKDKVLQILRERK